jgi:hypothetical protein
MDNKLNTFKIITLIVGMIVGIVSAYAQSEDSTKITRKVQVTFVHPLGSNGIEASKVINNISFNLLYGISGGVNGAEIGGLINMGYGDIKGFQFAGLGNSTTGWLNGFQVAGLYNVVMNSVTGFQFSGITNINRQGIKGAGITGISNIIKGDTRGFLFAGLANNMSGAADGFQVAGLYNYVEAYSKGAQFAGLTNINLQDSKGAYFAGLTNISNGNSRGAQFSGLANVNMGHMNGAQIAGLTNVNVKDMHGAQIAGLSNITTGTSQKQIAGLANIVARQSSGLQLAGLTNISPKEHKGSQIAGLFNYTRTLNGFQLALLNITDTIKRGVPIGFMSIVKHGYRRLEFEGNEVLFANLNFKTGTTRFYNIFSVGYRPQGEKQHWGVTYGIGTLAPVSKRFNFNFDITATHLNEDEAWTNELNLLNRLKFNVSYLVSKRLEIIGGPSLNVAVSRLRNSEGEVVGSSIVPSYSFYNETINGTNVKMYVGFNVGIRF